MAKTKATSPSLPEMPPPAAPATQPRQKLHHVVTEIVKKLGSEANYEAVVEVLRTRKLAFSENTIRQYVSSIKIEMGFSTPRTRTTGSARSSSETPTIDDLISAQELLESREMSPTELREFVAELMKFGELPKLVKCLDALDRLLKNR